MSYCGLSRFVFSELAPDVPDFAAFFAGAGTFGTGFSVVELGCVCFFTSTLSPDRSLALPVAAPLDGLPLDWDSVLLLRAALTDAWVPPSGAGSFSSAGTVALDFLVPPLAGVQLDAICEAPGCTWSINAANSVTVDSFKTNAT